MSRSLCIRVLLFTPVLCFGVAFAVQPREWLHATEADFAASQREHAVVTNLGEIQLARATEALAELGADDSLIYDIQVLPNGALYLAAGPQGGLLAMDRETGELKSIAQYDHQQVFALAGETGALYVAVSGAESFVEVRNYDQSVACTIALPDVRYVWDLALRGSDTGLHELWIATGTDGKVLVVDLTAEKPEPRVALDSEQPNVLCLAQRGDHVFAGTDGEGLVYRITPQPDDAAVPFATFIVYDAAEPEIGALLAAEDGMLYVGTADAEQARPGRLTEAAAEEFGKPDQPAAMPVDKPDPAPLPDGEAEADQPRDAADPPAPADDGDEPAAEPADVQPDAPDEAETAEVNPTADQYEQLRQAIRERLAAARESGGMKVQPMARRPGGGGGSGGRNASASPARPGGASSREGNAVYQIDTEGFVREVFRESVMILRLATDEGRLLIATGNEGQLYRVDPANREYTVLADLDPQQMPALATDGEGGLLIGTANPGVLLHMAGRYAAEGRFTADPLDAAQISRWGKLRLVAVEPDATAVKVLTRTGNVGEPDAGSWSAWSEPIDVEPAGEGAPVYLDVPSPPARFIQYRLVLTSAGDATPRVSTVALKYLMPNIAPRIKAIKAEYADNKSSQKKGRNPPPAPRTTLKIEWEVEDANEDQLRHTLQMRLLGDDANPFIPVTEPLTDPAFEWDTRAIPDGRYVLRVTASDALDNVPAQAKTTAHLSRPVVVDNTPPEIVDLRVDPGEAGAVKVTMRVTDVLSTVAAVRYAVDGGEDWQAVLPDDLIYDSTSETVSFTIPRLSPGPHVVSIRAEDDLANSRYASRTVRVAGEGK